MKFKVENTEKANEIKIEITVEASKFEEAIKKVYQKSVKFITIPGFRKGKAPMQIVEKYYGKEIFFEDAFNEIAPEAMEEAVKESKLDVVGRPDIEVTKIAKGEELVFVATMSIKPEVIVKKYKGIEIEKIEYNVTDEDIEHELTHMQEHNSRMISVEDRNVEDGDFATIDYLGTVNDVAFEGGTAENHELEIGSNTFIPGFESQVIGMEIGEEKDINVTFPKEYFSEDLAGSEAVFKVKVNAIKTKELPKVDDEFAKDVSEFETLKDLKNNIKENKQKENEEKAKFEKEEAVIKEICKDLEVDIPEAMIDLETDNMLQDIESKLSYQGLTLDQYLGMMNKQRDDIKEEYKEQAIASIKSRLAIESITKQEKIEVSDSDIDEKLKEMAKNYGKEADESFMNNENVKDYIKKGLAAEKTLKFLVENAKVVAKAKEEKEVKKTESKAKTTKKEEK